MDGCGYCGDEFEPGVRIEDDPLFGDVHGTHIDNGELPEDGDSDGLYDAWRDRCDELMGA